jgi:hypothetical protein
MKIKKEGGTHLLEPREGGARYHTGSPSYLGFAAMRESLKLILEGKVPF